MQAQPAAKPLLGTLDRMLSCAGSEPGFAWPKGSAEQVEAAWEDWDRVLELFRLMFETPEFWAALFTTSMAGMLTPQERLALPGQTSRFVGGDATLERVGGMDWGRQPLAGAGEGEREEKAYLMTDSAPLLRQLESAPGVAYATELDRIAIVELLIGVVMATLRGHLWRGDLVFYVTDNTNTQSWINKRRPGHPVARLLIMLLIRLECCHGFTMIAYYIRTFHNTLADDLTRRLRALMELHMAEGGWVPLKPPAEWGAIRRPGDSLAYASPRRCQRP